MMSKFKYQGQIHRRGNGENYKSISESHIHLRNQSQNSIQFILKNWSHNESIQQGFNHELQVKL